MDIPLYVVDAFTDKAFSGNPAAICPLDKWIADDLMQAIAAENNLSETAFLVPAKDGWELRWFTPSVEVDLCGHATLASAFALSLESNAETNHFLFYTKSGELQVRKSGGLFTLDFPSRSLDDSDNQSLCDRVEKALGSRPANACQAGNTWIAEYGSEHEVKSFSPDYSQVKALDTHALIVTAKGENCDYVSRFFAPAVGIDEDPVTGSAHCGLIPYWHRKTGKSDMLARQVSSRGGELHCKYLGERVEISGQAVLFSQGKISLAP